VAASSARARKTSFEDMLTWFLEACCRTVAELLNGFKVGLMR